MEQVIIAALGALQSGGPAAVIIAVLVGGLGLTLVAVKLVGQLHRLAPVITALRRDPSAPAPEPDPDEDEVPISDRTALLFGEALCASCSVAAIAIGPDHRIQLYNDAAEALTGWSREELIGQDLGNLMPPDEARRHAGFVRTYLANYASGGPRLSGAKKLVQLRHRDGDRRPVWVSLIHINRGSQVIFAWLTPAHSEGD